MDNLNLLVGVLTVLGSGVLSILMALNVIRVGRWFQAIFTFGTAGMIVTFISDVLGTRPFPWQLIGGVVAACAVLYRTRHPTTDQ